MLLTVSLFMGFFFGSILCIALGIFAKRFDVLFFGATVMFLIGLWTLSGGISYDSGEVITVVGDDIIVTDTYSTTTDVWTNAFGLLLVLVAAGLLLTHVNARKAEKEEKLRGIELDD